MADPKELANKARTTLAAGLDALQSDQEVPEALLAIAEPIAETMGLLHRIEKGGSADASLCKQALERTRGALEKLQKVDADVEAVDQAMEAVAGSLSMLFALSKAIEARGASAPQAAASAQPAQPTVPLAQQPAFAPPAQLMQQPGYAQPPQAFPAQGGYLPQAMPAQGGYPQQQPGFPPQSGGFAQQAAFPPSNPAAGYAPTIQAPAQPPSAPAQPFATTQPAVDAGLGQTVAIGGQTADDHHVPGTTGLPPPPVGARVVDVELGAHSPSNFYKGLSGNDVIDHGGIFVATYLIPKVGTPVALRMLLPGDLEFLADAVVQWTRETRGGETDPGFGAKFTRISPEGRQLVYRYVRNREPIFYDDM